MAWGGFSSTVWKMQLFLHYNYIGVCSMFVTHMQSKTHHACSHAQKNFMKLIIKVLKSRQNLSGEGPMSPVAKHQIIFQIS